MTPEQKYIQIRKDWLEKLIKLGNDCTGSPTVTQVNYLLGYIESAEGFLRK